MNNEIDPCEPYNLNNDSNEQVTGSGFFVRPSALYLPREFSHKRFLLTNAHVVEGSSTRRINISFPHLGNTVIWGTVILACRSLDFAVVEVVAENNLHMEKELGQSFNEVFKTIPFVKMSSNPVNTCTTLATDVLAIGYPLDSSDAHISTGCISGKHEHYLQINGSINSGNSGGPLFDTSGTCIGINAASFEESEGITLAVEWSHVITMLRDYWDQKEVVIYPPSLGLVTKKLIDSYAKTKLVNADNIKGVLVKKILESNSFTKHLKRLKEGDVIMSIGDHKYEWDLDRSGNVSIPFQHDKVKFDSLNVLMLLDRKSTFIRVFSNGKRKTYIFELQTLKDMVRYVMPSIENIPYFTFGGLVFTQLTRNHLDEVPEEVDPHIVNFLSTTNGAQEAVVISSYHIPCCLLEQGYSIKKLSIVEAFNNTKIRKIKTLRTSLSNAYKKYKLDPENKKKRFVNMKTSSDNFIIDLNYVTVTEMLLTMTPSYPESICELDTTPTGKKRKR